MSSPLSTSVTVGANVEALTKIAMRKTTAEQITALLRTKLSLGSCLTGSQYGAYQLRKNPELTETAPECGTSAPSSPTDDTVVYQSRPYPVIQQPIMLAFRLSRFSPTYRSVHGTPMNQDRCVRESIVSSSNGEIIFRLSPVAAIGRPSSESSIIRSG